MTLVDSVGDFKPPYLAQSQLRSWSNYREHIAATNQESAFMTLFQIVRGTLSQCPMASRKVQLDDWRLMSRDLTSWLSQQVVSCFPAGATCVLEKMPLQGRLGRVKSMTNFCCWFLVLIQHPQSTRENLCNIGPWLQKKIQISRWCPPCRYRRLVMITCFFHHGEPAASLRWHQLLRSPQPTGPSQTASWCRKKCRVTWSDWWNLAETKPWYHLLFLLNSLWRWGWYPNKWYWSHWSIWIWNPMHRWPAEYRSVWFMWLPMFSKIMQDWDLPSISGKQNQLSVVNVSRPESAGSDSWWFELNQSRADKFDGSANLVLAQRTKTIAQHPICVHVASQKVGEGSKGMT